MHSSSYQKHSRKSLHCYLEELYDPLTKPDQKYTLKDLKSLIIFLINNGFTYPHDFFSFLKSFKVDSKKMKAILTNFKRSYRNIKPSYRTINHATSDVINIVLTFWCFKSRKDLFYSIIFYVRSFPDLNSNEFYQKLSEHFNQVFTQSPQFISKLVSPSQGSPTFQILNIENPVSEESDRNLQDLFSEDQNPEGLFSEDQNTEDLYFEDQSFYDF